jgi:hypothetical protein
MKKLSLSKMENIKGGFSWSGFFYGACQGFTAVGVFASPIGIVRVVFGGATIGCLALS